MKVHYTWSKILFYALFKDVKTNMAVTRSYTIFYDGKN